MKNVKIPEYKYKNGLGSILLKNITVLFLNDEDVKKYKTGTSLRKIEFALSGDTIEDAEKALAVEFFKKKFRAIFDRKYEIKTEELISIQQWLGLNNVEFSTVLGVDKGAYSNILKRGKLSHTVGVLAIERLGNDLLMPGSAKRLIDKNAPLQVADAKTTKEINDVIYGKLKPLAPKRKNKTTTRRATPAAR